MKRIFVLPLVLAALIAVPSLGLAQEDSTSTTTADPVVAESIRERLETRLADQRQAIEARLTQSREQALRRACEAAQTALNSALSAGVQSYRARQAAYTNVLDNINDVLTRLTATTDIDTTALASANEAATTAVQAYESDFALFEAAVQAAVEDQECSDDPSEFHLNLEYARELAASLRRHGSEIRQAFNTDLRQALTELRSQLTTDQAGEAIDG